MTNKEIKQDIIEKLFQRPGIYTRKINDKQYRTRCPLCGDSKKNENTGHFYIKIDTSDNSPIAYHCFLCEEGGILQPSLLSLLEIDDIDLKSNLSMLNKTSDKIDKKGLINNNQIITFDYKLPEITRGVKTEYIEKRLGLKITDNEFRSFKTITSLSDFLLFNNIHNITCSPYVASKLESKYIGFLSHGNSHILFRDITDTEELRWVKYPITPKSSNNRIFYSIESEVDIFTKDKIIINLAEGVLDILSANLNLKYNKPNTVNICVSGKYYDSIIMYLISIGFVGSNIELNIFADNDAKFNNKNINKTTSLTYYKKMLNKYRYLFKDCNVYYNLKSKDIGVPIDKIILEKYTV